MPDGKPTKKGYTFDGWYDENDKKVTGIPAGSTGDKVFYAKWKVINYQITYVLDGGTNAADNPTEYDIEDDEIVLSDPTKEGYKFLGWYDNAAFEGEAVKNIPKGSTGDKVFYAKWEVINYSITYYVDGEVYSVDDKYSTYNIETGLDALPAAPEKEGYTFKGWYENAAFEGDAVTVILAGSTGAKTFYAKWEEILVEP